MVDYAFDNNETELARLMHQARVLEPTTARLLDAMDLKPGMQVLDLGCGAGDVTLLAARKVGRRGHVTGIDISDAALALATRRARAARLPQVRFEKSAIADFASGHRYDAVVGRYIMIHQADPVAFLRQAARLVKPGGVLGLHEIVLAHPFLEVHPPVPEWNKVGRWIVDALTYAAQKPKAAMLMVQYFAEAGLPAPVLLGERPMGGDAQSPLFQWAVQGVGGVLPHLVKLGKVVEGGVDLNALEARLRRNTLRAQAQLIGPLQVTAWTKIAG
ncbi:SAM-dependent methyltransferase [Pseudomonas eucalypticola]|uniref:Class I SAM-dependent methyltransferase n=1 Tax=Pseudomonas eucalypticola TaxID=2599595 RepID=A0A7D5H6X2_9PSED|nr:methyltransferase domain-containing protein [Pseudomonas eucalypticola]QKZ04704.1 class I SAM-dependent methyltransferase [Pseudomonas eucalypticola]